MIINSSAKFTVDKETCTYQKKSTQISFDKNEIEKIETYKSKSLSNRQFHIFPWDFYHYSIIFLKSGERIVLSSLIVFEIEKILHVRNTYINFTLYPWIPATEYL
jgi:hypothetical protein